MEYLEWQLARFDEARDRPAIIWRDREFSYGALRDLHDEIMTRLRGAAVTEGSTVAVIGDYSPSSVACLIALAQLDCILVPLSRQSVDQHEEFLRIAEVDFVVEVDSNDRLQVNRISKGRNHPLLEQLRLVGDSGLILFSSGSTGKPKAILHSLPKLLEKFRQPRHCYRTLIFLLFDHIGGLNTLFYTLANLGCLVVVENRSAASVCEAIEKHRAELLPTSPSFLNLMLMSGAPQERDLSSLRLITYGTEVMPERTLRLANEAFPTARFQQTYGLSELGILRSKSAADSSLLVRVGGEGYETRVVNGTLQVRAQSSMLGYLNAPSPFDDDGWFDTGDAVIQEGDFYRILGRQSEIINVGGQKVYPTEVEKVLSEIPGIIDVTVKGEPHMLLGQIVVAMVEVSDSLSASEIKKRIQAHSRGRLQPYMIPMKVKVVEDSQVNYRYKKVRR